MDEQQRNKTHKTRSVGHKASKKEVARKTKKGIDLQPNRGSNPKAFRGASNKSRKVTAAAHAHERREGKLTLPSVDRSLRSLLQEPPLLVAVVGPPGCGKTTLIRSMVRFYTQRNISKLAGSVTVVVGRARRVTFIECPNKLSAMCDLAKMCDLAVIMIDGAFGFELETFEFLTIAQTHGFPKVMGVISKLDMLRTNKQLKKTKSMLRHRFWHEVSAGAPIMCLAPMVRGSYRPSDVLKMHRSLVTTEPKMQQWRTTHSGIFVDRYEDVTDHGQVEQDPNASRSIAFYGYVRGKPIAGPGDKLHIPGLGDVVIANISRQTDPCESAESNATSQGSKMRTLTAKQKRCYAPYCNVGGVEFDDDGIYVTEDADLKNVERTGAGLELMREMQRGGKTLDDADGNGKSSSGRNKKQFRVIDNDNDDDDDWIDEDEDDVDADVGRKNNHKTTSRRRVNFANEDTMDIQMPEVQSGSDDDSSSSDDDDDVVDPLAPPNRRAADGDDDDELYEYGNDFDGGNNAHENFNPNQHDDIVGSFSVPAGFGSSSAAPARQQQRNNTTSGSATMSTPFDANTPLKPFERDSCRVNLVSTVNWIEPSNRLKLKSLFTTGAAATTTVGQDGGDGGGEGGLTSANDPFADGAGGGGGDDAESLGGYESVDSDEANDPDMYTSAAAAKGGHFGGGGDESDDDDEDLDNDDDDDDGMSDSDDAAAVSRKKRSGQELSDDLQQYVDFFVARGDDDGAGANNTGGGVGNSKASATGGVVLDETDALVGATQVSGAGGRGSRQGRNDYNDGFDPSRNNNKAQQQARGRRGGHDDDDGDDDNNADDDDDMLVGGGGGGGQQNVVDEDYIKKKMEKKKLFDESYDATGGKNNTTGFYHHLLEEEKDRQQNIKDTLQDVGEDIDKRIKVVGYFSGVYIRFVVHDVPVEFVRNFDPCTPIIAGGINPGEDRLEVVHTRFLRHRWYPKILKAQDPICISIGWRRIQVQPLYATEDGNGRWRYLKYTPKHMHCLSAFYGPVVPPNTGFIVIPTVEQKSPYFRATASGYTIGVDDETHIVKKLKITGTPQSIQKTTCFVKGMFNSDVEAAKFVGAKVKTVSGLRGSIKKVIKGKNGIVRCTFEDKLLPSDICFVRTWKPVNIPKYCEVVPNLLMPHDKQWRGMRTMAQIRRDEGIELTWKKDSEYHEIKQRSRGDDDDLALPQNIGEAKPSMLVSRNMRMKLPFNMREEYIPLEKKSRLDEQVRAEQIVAPEPKEAERRALLSMFRDKTDAMKERKLATKRIKAKSKERIAAKEEMHYKEQLKKAKKQTARKLEFRTQHKSRNKK